MSQSRSLHVGCVQGSIHGPKLFNIYCLLIPTVIPSDSKIIIYADDSYVINTHSDIQTLREKTTLCLTKHTEALRSIGMVVNTSKTELMLLSRNKQVKGQVLEINIPDAIISSKPHIKALGVIFSSDLSWSRQIDNALKRSTHAVKKIRFLSKWLDKKDLLQLVTAQYFPVVYYASPLWINCLDYVSIKRLQSAHYRAIRAALRVRDVRSKSRLELDALSSRATPTQWSNYTIASTVIKLFMFSDTNIANCLREAAYINDRMPRKARFMDGSKYKVGRQSIINRIGTIFSKISFDWIAPMSDHMLRINLKHEFFSNPTNP